MLTGRQILFRILEHFKLPAGRTKVLTLNHLLVMKMQKDDLRLFNRQWTEIVVQMNPEPDPQVLEAVYQAQLDQCTHFKTTMQLYRMQNAQGMGVPSYERLRLLVKNYLEESRIRRHETTGKTALPGFGVPALTDTDNKEKVCRQMAKMGKCSRGDKCPFKHTNVGPRKGSRSPARRKSKGKGKGKSKKRASTPHRPDASTSRPGSRASSPARPKTAACNDWKKGNCKRGEKCRWPHVAKCRFYPNCHRGEACEFAHHEKSSTRTTSMKTKAALPTQSTQMAGVAVDLSMATCAMNLLDEAIPMAFMARGNPEATSSPTKLANCLLRSRVHFFFSRKS